MANLPPPSPELQALVGDAQPATGQGATNAQAQVAQPAAEVTGAVPPPSPGLANFVKEQIYGTPEQQAITAGEGFARGATLGASDYVETKTGLSTPEAMKAREDENPWTSNLANVAGSAALVGITGGAAAPIEGELIAGGLGPIAAKAAGFGVEGGIFGLSNAVSDSVLGNTDLTAGKVLANVGLGAVLGGGLGAAAGKIGELGAIGDKVSSLVDENNASAKISSKLADEPVGTFDFGAQKETAPDIVEAAQRLGAPVAEGMTSANPWIQRAEDSLVNSAPTYSGIKRANLYNQGYQAVNSALDDVLGEEGRYSKAELGKIFQDSITSQIATENEPISQLYNEIKQTTDAIPLSERSAPAIARNIGDLREFKLAPNSPEGKMLSGVMDTIGNLKTVDDVKWYKSTLNGSLTATASPNEKRLVGIISDKLTNLEESSIEQFAENNMKTPQAKARVLDLINQRKAANAQYKPFIEKVGTLAEQLGKGKVYGPQDAINFIQNLTPEQVTQRLFAKNNSEFLSFFDKNFPEQAALMREYQKGVLRESASKTGELSPKVLFNKVNSMEPEVQKSIFHPDELQKLKDAETYLRSFPKNFNPSGTERAGAFKAFFEHPAGAAISNLRDYGIEAFIKAMGGAPEAVRPNQNPYEVGQLMADKLNKFKALQQLNDQADETIQNKSSSIFSNAARAGAIAGAARISEGDFNKQRDQIQSYSDRPDVLMEHASKNVSTLSKSAPNVSQALQNQIMNGVGFLNQKLPKPPQSMPLSQDWKPSKAQMYQFNKYYEAVNSPMNSLDHVKRGTLSNESMEALNAVHPALLNQMRGVVQQNMNPQSAKNLPFAVKQAISKFLGTPLDGNMTPMSIASSQAAFNGPQLSTQTAPKQGRKTGNLGGLKQLKSADRTQTRTQDDGEE
jgi:hypothetical protein